MQTYLIRLHDEQKAKELYGWNQYASFHKAVVIAATSYHARRLVSSKLKGIEKKMVMDLDTVSCTPFPSEKEAIITIEYGDG